MTHLLITDRNHALRDKLAQFLAQEGFQIKLAGDEAGALRMARESGAQVILLNLIGESASGAELCDCMRAEGAKPSVWMTAERGAPEPPKEQGNGAMVPGAEGTHLKDAGRQPEAYPRLLTSGDLVLDLLARRAVCNGRTLGLTLKEFHLLVEFVQHRGVLLSRAQLFELVWGGQYDGDRRTLDVHISWLRKKIEQFPERPQRITTVRSLGYRFEH